MSTAFKYNVEPAQRIANVNKNLNNVPSNTCNPKIAPISIPTVKTNETILDIVKPFLNLVIRYP